MHVCVEQPVTVPVMFTNFTPSNSRYNNTNAPLQAAWAAMQFTKAGELLAYGRGAASSEYSQQDQVRKMWLAEPTIHVAACTSKDLTCTLL